MEWNDKLAAELLDFKRGFYSRGFPSEKVVEDFINSKQPKLDYEIISFEHGLEKYMIGEYGWYHRKNTEFPASLNHIPKTAEIVSVKRLSDNEVFTIGDSVEYGSMSMDKDSQSEINKFKISRFEIIGNLMYATFERDSLVWITLLQKSKQSLFTPEQEMEIVNIIKETFKFLKK